VQKIFFKIFFYNQNKFLLRLEQDKPNLLELASTNLLEYYGIANMAEPTGLTDIEGQEIDSNWDEVSYSLDSFSDSLNRSLTILTIWA
jgi:hypothetical protein